MSDIGHVRVVRAGDTTTVEIAPLGWAKAAPVIFLVPIALAVPPAVIAVIVLRDAPWPLDAGGVAAAVTALFTFTLIGFLSLTYGNNALRRATLTAGPAGLTLEQWEWYRTSRRNWPRARIASVVVETQDFSGRIRQTSIQTTFRRLAIHLEGGEVVRLAGYGIRDGWETVAVALKEALGAGAAPG